MQLKKKNRSVRGALTMATCALFTGTPHLARATGAEGWQGETAVLGYSETDRVSVTEPVIQLKKSLGDDESITLKYVYDSMTGASPNGATATDKPQTFTSPSGTSYTVAPNETPLRDFRDDRNAISADWEKPLTRMVRGVFGVNYSTESDYTSLGASATLSLDLNNRLTTLTGGLSYSADTVDPDGGAPVGLADISTATEAGSQDKNTTDLLLGVTQVLNRRTLMQFNYGHGSTDGYMTDPYKLISVVDASSGDTLAYRYEKRPDTRARDTLYWKTVYHLPQDVVHVTYRYFQDDWDVTSHTLDFRYRYELGGGQYLQPHVRWYSQSAADFYRHSLVDGEPLPQYASADYRLGEMVATTVGLKYGIDTDKRGNFSVRAEYMQQSGDGSPSDAIGVQRTQDLFPTVEAWILQLSYSKKF